MKTSIDTILESMDKAIKNLSYYDGFDNDQWEKALAALSTIEGERIIWQASVERLQKLLAESTIDPDVKPQEPSEDAEAFCKRHQYLMSPKIIKAHDDAIRRECADRAISIIKSFPYDGADYYQIDFDELTAAILATEPAREKSCETCKHDGSQMRFRSGCTGCGSFDEYLNYEPTREEL